MRPATLQEHVYQEIKQSILQRTYPAGMFFPPEPELASRFGVSRPTLRSALKRLEEDGLIDRVSGKGTCVRQERKTQHVVYLAPCPNRDTLDRSYSFMGHGFLLQGLTQSLYVENARLEIVPVSQNNDMKNIDWIKLFELKREDKVFLPGTWYQPLFQYMDALGCDVVLLNEDDDINEEYRPYMKNFRQLVLDVEDLTYRLTCSQLANGSRHPALFLFKSQEHRKRRVQGFYKALETFGIPRSEGVIICPQDFYVSSEQWSRLLTEALLEVRRTQGYDALLIEASFLAELITMDGFMDELMGTEPLRFASFNTKGVSLLGVQDLTTLDFDLVQAGAAVAEMLLSESREPVRVIQAGPLIRNGRPAI